MKKIFIKDDRLREIHSDLGTKIARMMKSGELKGSYTIKEATKEFKTKEFPGYAIYYGWEVTDHEDGWKIDELDDFEITIKKSGKYYCAECKQFFTENVIASHSEYAETFEGALKKFIKELRAQRKTLCVRGKAIEGEVAKAIYEKDEIQGTEKIDTDKLLRELKEEIKNCHEEDQFGYAKQSTYDIYKSVIKRLE